MNNKKIIDLYRKKTVVFTHNKKFIGENIVAAQNIYWKKIGKKSYFSHIAIICDDGYVYEATAELKFKFGFIPRIEHGIKRTEMSKYYENKIKKADRVGIQYNFKNITDSDWEFIELKAKEAYKNKTKYGFTELFGTLFILLKWKFYMKIGKQKKARNILKKENPLDIKNAVYCIAFVENLLGHVVDYCDDNWSNELLTVDHGWNTKTPHKQKKFEKGEI